MFGSKLICQYYKLYFTYLRRSAREFAGDDTFLQDLCEKELALAGEIFLLSKQLCVAAMVIHRARLAAQYALNGANFSCRLGHTAAEVLALARSDPSRHPLDWWLPDFQRTHSHIGVRRLAHVCRERKMKINLPVERAVVKHHPHSLLVLPCYEYELGGIISQPGGPDKQTQFWGVYVRETDGFEQWLQDFPNEAAAIRYAKGLAQREGLTIQPCRWKK